MEVLEVKSACAEHWVYELAEKIAWRLKWWKHGRVWKAELKRAARGEVSLSAFPGVAEASPLAVRRGRCLLDPELAALLSDDELGSWALDGATLDGATLEFLAHRLK